jgi:diguanylate cyclase (GGDEF)-like protein
MPFVVAGTILGGPVVGGWMGLLSQFERRELTSDVPWYGVLGNHAIIAIAALSAGAAGDAVGATSLRLGMEPGISGLVHAMVVAVVFVATNFLLVLPIVAMKRSVTLTAAARFHDGAFRTTVAAEAILAWLMALVYVSVGWWAPIVCVALVLVVWESQRQGIDALHDEMTGLLNGRGLKPHLEAAIRGSRAGRAVNALLVIDVNGLGEANRLHGTLAGDALIRGVAGRLRSTVRETDFVARPHRRGDEFHVLLTSLRDADAALVLARRIHDRLAKPLQIRDSETILSTGASVGVVILGARTKTTDEAISIADERMQHAKRNRLGVWAEDIPGPGYPEAPGDLATA